MWQQLGPELTNIKFYFGQAAPYSEIKRLKNLKNQAQNQLWKLVFSSIIAYKRLNFTKAVVILNKIIDQQEPQIKFLLYHLKAKCYRCGWKDEDDLKQCLQAYNEVLAIKRTPEVLSNCATMLNAWGEWLDSVDRHLEAVEKHRLAETLHLEAGRSNRDIARCKYLLLQSQYDYDEITDKEFITQTINLIDSFDGNMLIDYLFKGIMIYDIGIFDEAIKYFDAGLTIRNQHSLLLYYKAAALFEKSKVERNLDLKTYALLLTSDAKLYQRTQTPEDILHMNDIDDLLIEIGEYVFESEDYEQKVFEPTVFGSTIFEPAVFEPGYLG